MSAVGPRVRSIGFLAPLVLLAPAGCDTGITQGIYMGPDIAFSGSNVPTGLPCGVANLLQTRCVSCHGHPAASGATNSLVSREELIAQSPLYPGQTEAQRMLARLQANTMPPGGGVTAAEKTALSDWIAAGTPASTCDNVVDAGTPADLTYIPTDSGPPGTGLPCALYAVLEYKCASCHGTPLRNNAPMRLTTRDDLLAASQADPKSNYAQRSVIRMMASEMPPNVASPAADITAFTDWIKANYPADTCGNGDGGVPPDPLNAAPTCTSGRTQQHTTRGSATMNPGEACNACHAKEPPGSDAVVYNVAGTLYATGHEPNDCAGVNGVNLANALVVITDANKLVYNLHPNTAGNFYLQSRTFKAPYSAKVTYMGRERPMSATQTDGDCNGCHNQNGSQNAPGRVTLPP